MLDIPQPVVISQKLLIILFLLLKGIGLRMKGIEMNSDNRKEIRNNKQIIQFIMERHEGFQWNNRKESHLYLFVICYNNRIHFNQF